MKSLQFALGLALCCFVQAEWKPMTATDELLEDWMTNAVACDSSDTREQLTYMTKFVAQLSRPEEDVFSIFVILPMIDGCKNVTYQFRKGEDGKYHGRSGDTPVMVEALKTLGGCVMTIIKVGDEFRTALLHSRTVTQDPEILQKFKEECKRHGFRDDEIVVLNPTVKCPFEK